MNTFLNSTINEVSRDIQLGVYESFSKAPKVPDIQSALQVWIAYKLLELTEEEKEEVLQYLPYVRVELPDFLGVIDGLIKACK